MARFLVDVPADDVRKLDEIAKRERQVACGCFARSGVRISSGFGKEGFEKYFGLWARHGVEIEPHEYDRKRRAEWTRPWDDDYEEVRAESPDMFDEYDDKERAHYLALTRKAAAKHKKKAA